MRSYNQIRESYRPKHIRVLVIAESPPPAATITSSRHFYRSDKVRTGDRLFTNTMKALYSEAADKTEAELESNKEQWLRRFQRDGWYMIEALEESQPHEATKAERQARIQKNMSTVIERVRGLAAKDTKVILIKSNVFVVAAEPLQASGFNVLNRELLDYPGQFNQRAYREKLAKLAALI